MILLITIFIGLAAAYWDHTVIRKGPLNHFIHAGARAGAYVILFLLLVDFSWLDLIGGWFIVTPVHRLALNAFMGWDTWYMGNTAMYDKLLHRLSDEPGQVATTIEIVIATILLLIVV